MRRSTRSKTNIEQLEEDGSGMIKKSLHCTTLYVPFVSFWLKNKSTLIARKKKNTNFDTCSQLVSQKP